MFQESGENCLDKTIMAASFLNKLTNLVNFVRTELHFKLLIKRR